MGRVFLCLALAACAGERLSARDVLESLAVAYETGGPAGEALGDAAERWLVEHYSELDERWWDKHDPSAQLREQLRQLAAATCTER
jgi:hypothetical protein